MAVLGGDVADTDTSVDSPLLALTEAVLVTDVAVDVQVLTLIALAVLPLQVVISDGESGTDVPSVEDVVVLAVAEPVAQFSANIEELVCVCVV